jgi:hypothetical protein
LQEWMCDEVKKVEEYYWAITQVVKWMLQLIMFRVWETGFQLDSFVYTHMADHLYLCKIQLVLDLPAHNYCVKLGCVCTVQQTRIISKNFCIHPLSLKFLGYMVNCKT